MTNYVLTTGRNLIDGTLQDDTFSGPGGGDDILFGDFGNDVFLLDRYQIGVVDGGRSTDTVIALDTTLDPALRIRDVETLAARTEHLGATVSQIVNISLIRPEGGGADFFLHLSGAGGSIRLAAAASAPTLNVDAIDALAAVSMIGSERPDRLAGSPFGEILNGGPGGDTITGGGGSDTIIGGQNIYGETADQLWGSAGADRFRFLEFNESFTYGFTLDNDSTGRDAIRDFEPGVDLIDLADLDAQVLQAALGLQHFVWVGERLPLPWIGTLGFAHADGDTILFGRTTIATQYFSVRIEGLHDLTAADFTNASIRSIQGGDGDDHLSGAPGGKLMYGLEGDDTVAGGSGSDTIYGGAGADVLTGGVGADRFVWNGAGHTGLAHGARDVITDFVRGVDKIDLSPIDANIPMGENNAFTFVGTAPHTGVGGTLRYMHSGGNTIIWGDRNADGSGDFAIELTGLHELLGGDFIL